MKRILAYMILILGLLAVAIPIAAAAWQESLYARWDPSRQRQDAMQALQARGVTPDLAELLAQGPKPDGWVATWVVEAPLDPMKFTSEDTAILVADPPGLAGKSLKEARELLRQEGNNSLSGTGTVTTSSIDGKRYEIWLMNTGVGFYPTHKQATWAALTVGLIAWLALAAWVWLDARDRGSNAAPGWLLLALLTGPVALAVWFISRYTQEGFAPLKRTCPGCGGDTPRSAAFCVRCGHALRPACPDCRRPVELDWAHCGTCGTELR